MLASPLRTTLGREWLTLEDRVVLSASPSAIVGQFDTLIDQVADKVGHWYDAVPLHVPLGTKAVEKFVRKQADNLKAKVAQLREKADATLDEFRADLTAKGVPVTYLSTTANAAGNLLEIDKTLALGADTDVASVADATDFSYFNNTFKGTVSGNLGITVGAGKFRLQLGVHENADQTVSGFLGTGTALDVAGVTIAGAVTGSGQVGDLANVQLTGTADVKLAEHLGFQDTHHNGRLTTADLGSGVTVTAGSLTGTAKLTDVKLTADVSGLSLVWTANFEAHTNNGRNWSIDQEKFVAPNASDVLKKLLPSFIVFERDIPLAQQLTDKLNTKLPVVNKTLAQLFGLEKYLTPGLKAINVGETQFEALRLAIEKALPGLKVTFKPADLVNLIQGKTVDFLKYERHFSKEWSLPLASGKYVIGIPGVASASISGELSAVAAIKLDVVIGWSSGGAWVGKDSGAAVTAGIRGTVTGKINVLGLIGVKASGSLTLNGELGVKLLNPPSGDRAYLTDWKSVAKQFKPEVSGHADLDFSGKLKILFWSKKFHWHKGWTLF